VESLLRNNAVSFLANDDYADDDNIGFLIHKSTYKHHIQIFVSVVDTIKGSSQNQCAI
jgi:hypothetical protein